MIKIKDPIPGDPKHTKIITYDVQLNEFGGIKKITCRDLVFFAFSYFLYPVQKKVQKININK